MVLSPIRQYRAGLIFIQPVQRDDRYGQMISADIGARWSPCEIDAYCERRVRLEPDQRLEAVNLWPAVRQDEHCREVGRAHLTSMSTGV